MANSNATPSPTIDAANAAFEDLIHRIRAIRNSAGNSPRQVAIGRAMTLLVGALSEAFEADTADQATTEKKTKVTGYLINEDLVWSLQEARDALSAVGGLLQQVSPHEPEVKLGADEMFSLFRVVQCHLHTAITKIEDAGYGSWRKSA